MNPAFIYCKESILNDDNKFVLDFSDEEFVHEVNFLNNLNYYITSVNDHKDNKDRKKLIEELSQKSRLLLKKGIAYQNDIGWMTSAIPGYFNFSGFGGTYNFILYLKTIDENSYKYKFCDTVEKKNRDCKIYSPLSHYKGNGFEFKRLIGPKKEEKILVSLLHNYKKIKTTFIHNYSVIWYYTNLKQRIMQLKQKTHLTLVIFGGDIYEVQKKGTGYVMGTLREWQKLVPKR